MAAAAISAADARRDDDIHAIDPVKLLSPRRIDLVCKSLLLSRACLVR